MCWYSVLLGKNNVFAYTSRSYARHSSHRSRCLFFLFAFSLHHNIGNLKARGRSLFISHALFLIPFMRFIVRRCVVIRVFFPQDEWSRYSELCAFFAFSPFIFHRKEWKRNTNVYASGCCRWNERNIMLVGISLFHDALQWWSERFC